MSAHLHVVIPDLFLPEELSSRVCAGLHLDALEKVLARAEPQKLAAGTLEEWLCTTFGVTDGAIAPVALRAEGVEPEAAYWLCADPVHLRVRHDELVVQPVATLSADEGRRLCADLTAHFAGEGLHFIAPHPQRWYLRLEQAPRITTHSLSEAAGRDVRNRLPEGEEALRWHGILNEIQMLLYAHPVNEAREARGEWAVNSVWLWGGGRAGGTLRRPFREVFSDSSLAGAFAAAANIGHRALPRDAASCRSALDGEMLVVWDGLLLALQHGDFSGWRESLQHFEQNCIHPALEALRNGLLDGITLDVPQGEASRRFALTRRAAWKFWRRGRPLSRTPA
jgi:hypothetical protein